MNLKLIVKTHEDGELLMRPIIEVINPETGEKLQWVRKVSFSADANELPIMTLEILAFEADIEAPNVCEKAKMFGLVFPDEDQIEARRQSNQRMAKSGA